MWMRIFSSDIRALYSLDVAPSETCRHEEVYSLVLFFLLSTLEYFKGTLNSSITHLLLTTHLWVVINVAIMVFYWGWRSWARFEDDATKLEAKCSHALRKAFVHACCDIGGQWCDETGSMTSHNRQLGGMISMENSHNSGRNSK